MESHFSFFNLHSFSLMRSKLPILLFFSIFFFFSFFKHFSPFFFFLRKHFSLGSWGLDLVGSVRIRCISILCTTERIKFSLKLL